MDSIFLPSRPLRACAEPQVGVISPSQTPLVYIYRERESLNVRQGCIPLTTRITSSEKLLSVVSVLRVIFCHFCTLVRKICARTVLSCVYFEMFNSELRDPEIFSASSSILRPFNIECSGFDPILLRFRTLLPHIYTSMCAYVLKIPCV